MNQTWTDENIEILRELWREGFSGAQIAKRIGGVSRNAVIGKAHRIGLSTHVNAVVERERKPAAQKKKNASKAKARVKAVFPFHAPAEESPPIVESIRMPRSLELTLMELDKSSCRWPSGARAPFTFCGHDVAEGKPYCAYHCRLSYEPNSRIREVA